jgi:hypothetical protein
MGGGGSLAGTDQPVLYLEAVTPLPAGPPIHPQSSCLGAVITPCLRKFSSTMVGTIF